MFKIVIVGNGLNSEKKDIAKFNEKIFLCKELDKDPFEELNVTFDMTETRDTKCAPQNYHPNIITNTLSITKNPVSKKGITNLGTNLGIGRKPKIRKKIDKSTP